MARQSDRRTFGLGFVIPPLAGLWFLPYYELNYPAERVERRILLIRGQKVLLDRDLAELYGVKTKAFNQALRCNIYRSPDDFRFELTADEFSNLKSHFGASGLRSQFVTSNRRGGRTALPAPGDILEYYPLPGELRRTVVD